jgi:hypothetical protein
MGQRLCDSPSVNRFAKSLTTFRDGIEPGAASAARGQGAERPFLFDESLSTSSTL